MSTNLYEIVFTADTTGAISGIQRVEYELVKLTQTATASSAALNATSSSLNGAGSAASAMVTNISNVTNMTSGLTAQLLNVSNALQLLSMAATVAFQFGDKINSAREAIQDMTEDAMKLRDTLREVANLQGKDGPDNEIVAEVLELGMKSGMMPKEAKEFMEQFLGSIPAGKTKGNITDDVAKEVAEVGAQFGVRVGVQAKTAGDFSAVMSQYQKIPDKETAAQVMGQVVYGLNEGRGNVEPLMRTLINTAGSVVEMGGPMESLSELAVMEGVASTHANPYATGTRLKQAVRALRETKGPQGEWLKQQGVEDGMSHLERLKAIKPALMNEVASGKGMDQALKEFVTNDDTEARSLAEQLGDIDLMDARLKKMGEISGQSVIEKNSKFFTSERAGIRRIQKARKAGQQFLIGQENEDMEMAKENAEQALRDEKKLGGTGNKFREWAGDWFGIRTGLGGESYVEQYKLNRATTDLIAEAKKRGMGDEQIYGDLGMNGRNAPQVGGDRAMNFGNYAGFRRGQSENDAKEGFRRLSRSVERQGGNVFGAAPDIAKKLDTLVNETKAQTKAIQENKEIRARNMPPARPEPPRPGAAAPKRP